MSQSQKQALFTAGRYRLRIRPSCSAWWSVADWIAYIDRFGRWLDAPLTQDSV